MNICINSPLVILTCLYIKVSVGQWGGGWFRSRDRQNCSIESTEIIYGTPEHFQVSLLFELCLS